MSQIVARKAAPVNRVRAAYNEQGFNARQIGFERDTVNAEWTEYHKAGWDVADSMIKLNVSPLPAWPDLVAQMAAGAI